MGNVIKSIYTQHSIINVDDDWQSCWLRTHCGDLLIDSDVLMIPTGVMGNVPDEPLKAFLIFCIDYISWYIMRAISLCVKFVWLK